MEHGADIREQSASPTPEGNGHGIGVEDDGPVRITTPWGRL